MTPFSNQSSNPKWNAQRNLAGRTHYVDDDTLRFHKSRVISSRASNDGLLFMLVTSDALDMHNTKRGFRYTIFSIDGHVLGRTNLERTFSRSEAAVKAMWKALGEIDVRQVMVDVIARRERNHAYEMDELRKLLIRAETAQADTQAAA